MAIEREAVLRVGVDSRDSIRGTKQLSSSLDKMSNSAKRAESRSQRLSRSLKGIRAQAAPLIGILGGLGVGLGFGKAIKSATAFEDALSQIVGLVGQSKEQVEAYRKAILELGPAIGKGPVELAEALFFITSAGFEGAAALDVLKQSALAASAGLGETKAVADAVTSAVNAYGKANLTAAQSTDVLVASVREGKAEASAIGRAIGQVLPFASQLGSTFDQVGASIAALTRIGLPARQAVTALRGVFQQLIKNGTEAQEALADITKQQTGTGETFADLRKELEEDGLISLLVRLNEVFDGNVDAIGKVFPNAEALVAVLGLVGKNGKQVQEIFASIANDLKTGGTTQKAYSDTETESRKMARALSDIDVTLISLGETSLPAVVNGFQLIAKLINTGTGVLETFGDSIGRKAAELVTGLKTDVVGQLLEEYTKLENFLERDKDLFGFSPFITDEEVDAAKKKMEIIEDEVGRLTNLTPEIFFQFKRDNLFGGRLDVEEVADDFIEKLRTELESKKEKLAIIELSDLYAGESDIEITPKVSNELLLNDFLFGGTEEIKASVKEFFSGNQNIEVEISEEARAKLEADIAEIQGKLDVLSPVKIKTIVEDPEKIKNPETPEDIIQKVVLSAEESEDLVALISKYDELGTAARDAADLLNLLEKAVVAEAIAQEDAVAIARKLGEEFRALDPDKIRIDELAEKYDSFTVAGKDAADTLKFLQEQVALGDLEMEQAVRIAKELGEEYRDLNPELRELTELQSSLASVVASTQTPLEAHNSRVEELGDLYEELADKGLLTAEAILAIQRATENSAERYAKELKNLDVATKNFERAYDQVGQSVSNAFSAMIQGADSFDQVMQGLVRSIADVIIQLLILKPLQDSLSIGLGALFTPSPSGGSSIPGTISVARGGDVAGGRVLFVGEEGPELLVLPEGGGKIISNRETKEILKEQLRSESSSSSSSTEKVVRELSSGGPIDRGELVIVGERGPELFVAGSAGQIIRNTETRQLLKERVESTHSSKESASVIAGKDTVVNINNYTNEEASVQRSSDSNGNEIVDIIIGSVTRDIGSNGNVSKAIQGSRERARR